MLENLIFLVASFFAAVAATLAGFGSSTLLIPVAIFFMDIKTAVFLVACFHLFNNVFKVRIFWNQIDSRMFLFFGIPSVLFAFIGANLISIIPLGVIQRALAVFLILFSVYSLIHQKFTFKDLYRNVGNDCLCDRFDKNSYLFTHTGCRGSLLLHSFTVPACQCLFRCENRQSSLR